jgi:hypothetical protein
LTARLGKPIAVRALRAPPARCPRAGKLASDAASQPPVWPDRPHRRRRPVDLLTAETSARRRAGVHGLPERSDTPTVLPRRWIDAASEPSRAARGQPSATKREDPSHHRDRRHAEFRDELVEALATLHRTRTITAVAGVPWRGFILGSLGAATLGSGFE